MYYLPFGGIFYTHYRSLDALYEPYTNFPRSRFAIYTSRYLWIWYANAIKNLLWRV